MGNPGPYARAAPTREAALGISGRVVGLLGLVGVCVRWALGGFHWTLPWAAAASLVATGLPAIVRRFGLVVGTSCFCGLVAGAVLLLSYGQGTGIRTPVVVLLPLIPLLGGHFGGVRLGVAMLGVVAACLVALLLMPADPALALTGPFRVMLAVLLLVSGVTVTVVGGLVEAERDAALRQAARTGAQLNALFEHAPVAMFMKDAQGRYMRVNKAYREAFSRGAEVLGRTHREFDPEGAAAIVEPRDAMVRAARQPHSFEDTFGHPDGPRSYLVTLFPVQLGGEGMGLGGVTLDITDRARAEAQLQRALEELRASNRELERFAYVVSHDLQEPLRTVANFTQLLVQQAERRGDSSSRKYAEYILGGTRRMRELITGLLEYARVGTRELPSAPVSCDLVLQQVLADLADAIEGSGAVVEFGSLPALSVHGVELRQLLLNLLSNALKFRKLDRAEPHRVRVRAEREGEGWRLSVEDNGVGMTREARQRIFEVFQRAHDRHEYGGTGVGLAICRKIVESHGGRIWVESERGVGSVFHAWLPDRPAGDAALPEGSEAAAS